MIDAVPTIAADVADRIADELVARLDAERNALAGDPDLADQLRAQVHAILGRAFDRLGLAHDDPPPVAGAAVGRARASQNVHPADSLAAATMLFDIALERIRVSGVDASAVARALNLAIMEDVVPASVAYVNVLLERLAVAHSEERLGISRELHDRVAHGIAAGIQRVQLSRHTDAPAQRLEEALRLLDGALEETRSLALDLRHSVGDKHLDEAIADYILDLDGVRPHVQARTLGTPRSLAAGLQEEAFLVVREAIHNARRHSRAGRIIVTSEWTPGALAVTVADNGTGFARDGIRPGALGLITAQERAELIGAELAIDSQPGVGTTVTLTIPRREGDA